MRSPFPGMDPYLEGDLWQEFHSRLLNQISEQLIPQLYPKYIALLAKRYVYDAPLGILEPTGTHSFYPDVHVLETGATLPPAVGGVAVVEPTKVLLEEKVPQLRIEIRDTADRRLVTIIKLLSPADKRGKGFKEYRKKRAELLKKKTHLLEIDLLRRGNRLVDADELQTPYVVYLSRFTNRSQWLLWELPLRQRLPVLPVPLLPPDADVPLDLQAAVDASYAVAHYELLIDYTEEPPPPSFSAADQDWLQSQIARARSR